jgi:hypothetical protein
MWWNYQNLNIPREAKDGSLWHFRVWHGNVQGIYTQRIYFWDEAQKTTGYVELAGDQTLHISKLKQRMNKIVANPEYRVKYLKELIFPIEKHYS